MNKILIASLILLASNAAFAAKTNQVLAAGANTVTTGGCNATAGSLLEEDVPINLSAGNSGNVSCDDASANIGIAVANSSGRNNIYVGSSAGGGVAVSASSPLAATPVASDISAASDIGSDAAGGGGGGSS